MQSFSKILFCQKKKVDTFTIRKPRHNQENNLVKTQKKMENCWTEKNVKVWATNISGFKGSVA